MKDSTKRSLKEILIFLSFFCAIVPCFGMVISSCFERLIGNNEGDIVIQFVIGSLSTLGVLVLTIMAFKREE